MDQKEAKHTYEDIIEIPYRASQNYPRMERVKRAAQFAPFAAITGHREQIIEVERKTTKRKELAVDQQELLTTKLSVIDATIKEQPTVAFTYFIPDNKKEGGEYVTIHGVVKRIDTFRKQIILMDGTIINIHDLFQVDI